MAEMKNQKLLNKALNLLPDLVETKVDAVQTVEMCIRDRQWCVAWYTVLCTHWTLHLLI